MSEKMIENMTETALKAECEEAIMPELYQDESTAVRVSVPKMYVGPTIPGFAIQNRVYFEIPEYAAKIIKDRPELGNLFIDIRDYPKANRMLRERNGYIFSAYIKALELRK